MSGQRRPDLDRPGRHMVEANAGTGKTYTITTTHLRWLLLGQQDIENILVVTFTRAATAELKQRLRCRLREALEALTDPDSQPDPAVADIVAAVDDRNHAIALLERSLRAFDLAPVYTIHGFCQQVLKRFAFAAGWDPERELVEGEQDLLRPAWHRAWAEASAAFSPEFAAHVRGGSGVETLMSQGLRALVNQIERPWRTVVDPSLDLERITALEGEGRAARDAVLACWRSAPEAIERVESSKALRSNYFTSKRKRDYRDALEALDKNPADWLRLAESLVWIGAEKLAWATRKNEQPPGHPVDHAVDALCAAATELKAGYQCRTRTLWRELQEQVTARRDEIKRRQGLRTYNDLVADLDHALGRGPADLAARIRALYPVALIDEFQDTDHQQLRIFDAIYPPSSGPVVAVGDPKQALYGFRGADVHAYLRARDQADDLTRLARNWRSRQPLLAAVNALFGQVPQPFVTPGIDLEPSRAGDPSRPSALCEDGRECTAFEVRLLRPDGNKDPLRETVAAHLAAEVAGLLAGGRTGRVLIGDRAIEARDVCVLVRTHVEADRIAQALDREGLGCARAARTSVWQSDEATDLLRVLIAVNDCESPGKVAAALATRICGLDGTALAEMQLDPARGDAWYQEFADDRVLWREKGVVSLITRLIRRFDTAARWLADPRGERWLTNLMHLQDLLAVLETEGARLPAALLEGFVRQREQAALQTEDGQLLLESDENLVQVMTIHKAKGLEFPVVFCPFLWDTSRSYESMDYGEFHDDEGRPVLDLGGPEWASHKERCLSEKAAEDLRLLYVALTRASRRCVVTWCVHADAMFGPLRYLVYGDGDDGWRSGMARYRSQSDDERIAHIGDWLLNHGIPRTELPAERPEPCGHFVRGAADGVKPLAAPERLPGAWQVHSYSSLMHRRGEDAVHDHDALLVSPAEPEGPEVERIFQLPAGPTVGLMFHDLLEHLSSFRPAAEELAEAVARRTRQYGLGAEWCPVLESQVRACLETPLDDTGLRLADLDRRYTLSEMGFHLRWAHCDLAGLSDRVRPQGPPLLQGVASAGFLRGFIDLIFVHEDRYYVVDYKSNRLGDRIEDYRPEALRESVLESGYDLQYHLYTVALHRLLRQQLEDYDPHRHLGGVFYLYLRGMRVELGPRCGVHHARPSVATVLELDGVMA